MISLVFMFQRTSPGSSDCVPVLKTRVQDVLCVCLCACVGKHFITTECESVTTDSACVCVCVHSQVLKARVRSEGGNEEHFLLEEPYLTKVLPSSLRERDGKGHCKKGRTLQPTEIPHSYQTCFKGKFQIYRAQSPMSCIKGITTTQIRLTIKTTIWGLKFSGKADAQFHCNSKDNSELMLSWCSMLFIWCSMCSQDEVEFKF